MLSLTSSPHIMSSDIDLESQQADIVDIAALAAATSDSESRAGEFFPSLITIEFVTRRGWGRYFWASHQQCHKSTASGGYWPRCTVSRLTCWRCDIYLALPSYPEVMILYVTGSGGRSNDRMDMIDQSRRRDDVNHTTGDRPAICACFFTVVEIS